MTKVIKVDNAAPAIPNIGIMITFNRTLMKAPIRYEEEIKRVFELIKAILDDIRHSPLNNTASATMPITLYPMT